MKKASKRRILFAARMATMVGAACFAVSGISETLGQEKEKSRPVYIATEEVAETTYMPEVEEATQPTETAKAVETEEPLIASMDWDKDDSYLLYKKYKARLEDGFSHEQLYEAVKNYAAQCKKQRTETMYIKHGKTFLGESTPFLDYLPKDKPVQREAEYDDNENPFGRSE